MKLWAGDQELFKVMCHGLGKDPLQKILWVVACQAYKNWPEDDLCRSLIRGYFKTSENDDDGTHDQE